MADMSFVASQEDGTLREWDATSVQGTGSAIRAVSAAAEGIPEVDGQYVTKATLAGSGSGYARTHYLPTQDGGAWREGSDVWYGASFYLPDGFYDARYAGSTDLMRWDAYVDGRNDIQGGLGINSSDDLRIMSNYPFTQPLTTGYQIPEEQWTHVEVHQVISGTGGRALNEIYVNGERIASSTTANYTGSEYPAGEQAINRLRTGLVSEGDSNQNISLYFDHATTSSVQSGPVGMDTTAPDVISVPTPRPSIPAPPAAEVPPSTPATPTAPAPVLNTITGTEAANILTGTAAADRIQGLGGNDSLRGGAGKDVLTGGAGSDWFIFESSAVIAGNVDQITDFNSEYDQFDLGREFAALTNGSLREAEFRVGTTAQDNNDFLIYDQKKGELFYDADGSGTQAQIEIAQLQPNTFLAHWDFFVY